MHLNTFSLEEVRRLYQTVKGVHGTYKVNTLRTGDADLSF